jgi:hypothetical protein
MKRRRELRIDRHGALHRLDENRERKRAEMGTARIERLKRRHGLGDRGGLYLAAVVLVSHEHDVAQPWCRQAEPLGDGGGEPARGVLEGADDAVEARAAHTCDRVVDPSVLVEAQHGP